MDEFRIFEAAYLRSLLGDRLARGEVPGQKEEALPWRILCSSQQMYPQYREAVIVQIPTHDPIHGATIHIRISSKRPCDAPQIEQRQSLSVN